MSVALQDSFHPNDVFLSNHHGLELPSMPTFSLDRLLSGFEGSPAAGEAVRVRFSLSGSLPLVHRSLPVWRPQVTVSGIALCRARYVHVLAYSRDRECVSAGVSLCCDR